jgi:hypothetical protein
MQKARTSSFAGKTTGHRVRQNIDIWRSSISRKHVGALSRVFAVAYDGHENEQDIDSRKTITWTVPRRAQIDDLVLIYRAGIGISPIKDIWRISGRSRGTRRVTKKGPGQVCRQVCAWFLA